MVASVLQERETSSSAGGTNITLAFVSNVTAGSALHNFGSCDAGTAFAASNPMTDSLGNSYGGAALNDVTDTGVNQRVGHWAANNSGAGADTVTLTFAASVTFRALWIREIGGVTTTAKDGNNGRFQATPSTTTDATTSNAATNTNQPALMSALCVATSGAANPAAGTGFTSTTTGWATFQNSRSEHQRFTDTTSKSATFTAAANSGHVTLMAMFDESGGGGATLRKNSLLRLGVGR